MSYLFQTPEIRNRIAAEHVKAELVRFAMMKWPRNFSRNFDASLISGPKMPKGDVILAVNSMGVYTFADNPSRPFFFNLDYSQITGIASGRCVRKTNYDNLIINKLRIW